LLAFKSYNRHIYVVKAVLNFYSRGDNYFDTWDPLWMV